MELVETLDYRILERCASVYCYVVAMVSSHVYSPLHTHTAWVQGVCLCERETETEKKNTERDRTFNVYLTITHKFRVGTIQGVCARERQRHPTCIYLYSVHTHVTHTAWVQGVCVCVCERDRDRE